MAAKNLDEALTRALTAGPLSNLKENLKNELRDYVAHEVMRLERSTLTFSGLERPPTAIELFERIFKNIPAFNTDR